MSTLLKDRYSPTFYQNFAHVLQQTLAHEFNPQTFIQSIFTPHFEQMELKQRMTHTAQALHTVLPPDFDLSAPILTQLVNNLQQAGLTQYSLEYMFIPEYVSMYGLNNYQSAITAIETITQFTSCEFAVRPFIIQYPNQMMEQMLLWSKHQNNAVRRLASEGCRPRLPWAMALPSLKANPAPILPILENLKQDPCEIVRRSVANNLNDISKDNPHVFMQVIQQWQGISPQTDAIIKHASRTLLKAAHPKILHFYQLNHQPITLTRFTLHTPQIAMGNNLQFSFALTNTYTQPLTTRIEYAIYHKKSNGNLQPKVFKISERTLMPNETITITRNHLFKPITTRRYYAGNHKIALIINGQEKAQADFELQ
ncbi:MAG TPA: DNA alkylation repair protein [Chitinophagales bacterium]|nr:DNA alkylation repair protein [Chitinophagales bacterium]HRK27651.1 DNA alkylation repair protein [Chitinophagales bacterium]